MTTPVQAPSNVAPVGALAYGALGSDATFVDASHPLPVLIAGSNPTGIGIVGIGQSNQQPAYATLTYTPSALSGTGSAQTVTIAPGTSLRVGDTVKAQLTGAAPSGYNDAGYVDYVVGGTAPNAITLTHPGGTTGALTTAGTLTVNMRLSYPLAWASKTDASAVSPLPGKVFAAHPGANGTPLIALRDRLAQVSGRPVRAADCAIGSSSLIKQWVGQIASYDVNAHYRCRRAPVAGDRTDRGCIGQIVSVYTGSVFILVECTAGGDLYYMTNTSQYPLPGASPTAYGYGTMTIVAGGASGSAAPNWSSITGVGQTIVDNQLTWTCVAYNYGSSADPALNFPSDSRFRLLTAGKYGFDPFGLIQRTIEVAGDMRESGLVPVVTMIGHESDISAGTQTWFTSALQAMSDALTINGIAFAPSMTFFNPTSGSASQFSGLSAQVKTFLANNVGNPLVCQHALNLYDYFGQTPGSNGLYPQSDNVHPNENIHQSALTCTLAGPPMADAIWQDIVTQFA